MVRLANEVSPVRFGSAAEFEAVRAPVNERLLLSGFAVGHDGKVVKALETVASVDDMPVVEVIRAAIAEHIQARRRDEAFQMGLRERIERAQSMLRE